MRRKFTDAQGEQALLAHYGNVSAAARALEVDHSTLWNRIKRSERLRIAREEAEEIALDIAEASLLEAVKQGEAWAVCFLLKTRGKKRGYVERQEWATAQGNPFEVSIMAPISGPIMGGGNIEVEPARLE